MINKFKSIKKFKEEILDHKMPISKVDKENLIKYFKSKICFVNSLTEEGCSDVKIFVEKILDNQRKMLLYFINNEDDIKLVYPMTITDIYVHVFIDP